MSARYTMPAHTIRLLQWFKDPDRRPYRISILPSGLRIVRRGDVVIGSFDTNEDAHRAIDRDIARPWDRAA